MTQRAIEQQRVNLWHDNERRDRESARATDAKGRRDGEGRDDDDDNDGDESSVCVGSLLRFRSTRLATVVCILFADDVDRPQSRRSKSVRAADARALVIVELQSGLRVDGMGR